MILRIVIKKHIPNYVFLKRMGIQNIMSLALTGASAEINSAVILPVIVVLTGASAENLM